MDPQTDIQPDDHPPSRRVRITTVSLLLVSAIAVVVGAVGLVRGQPDPELTTAPPTTTTTEPPPPPQEYVRVTEPVEYPATIPGCETVEPNTEGDSYLSISSVGNEPGYDNPKFPWFNGPKATAMSDALVAALPADVNLEYAAPQQSLVFQPILDFDDGSGSVPDPSIGGETLAYGTISSGDARGSLSVSVRQSNIPPGPCVAGQLDERRILLDGTVVDLLDTWEEVNGARSLTRSAYAYTPDNTRISVRADDRLPSPDGTGANSGKVPFTLDELASLASIPGLRVTTAAPPGTPAPLLDCTAGYDETGGFAIEQKTVERLNSALDAAPPGGIALDHPLGSLSWTQFGSSEVCATLRVLNPGSESTLSVSVKAGRPTESVETGWSSSSGVTSSRILPDGTEIQRSENVLSGIPMDQSEPATTSRFLSVTVAKPSGTLVTVSNSAEFPAQALSFEQLESIALTSGVDL